MGFLNRLFGSKEPDSFAPPSEKAKQTIMLFGLSCNYDGLAKSLESKNPHVRAFTLEAVLTAGRTRSLGGTEFEFSQDATLDARAVRLLAPLLNDADEDVRKAALKALKAAEYNKDAIRVLEEYSASLVSTK